MSETRVRGRSFGGLRSTLIGVCVLAFTFFPPGRALLLWGIGVQIAVILARRLIERQVHDPARAAQALTVVELLGDGATVLLFALATFGGILQLEQQV